MPDGSGFKDHEMDWMNKKRYGVLFNMLYSCIEESTDSLYDIDAHTPI